MKLQVRALEASKPTDQFVTMRITGDGELEKKTRAGWDLVVKVEASEQAFLDR